MANEDGAMLGAEAARRLASLGRVEIGRGLSDAEFDRVERRFGFEFADDHRAFLAAGLPLGKSWPDWRNGDPNNLHSRLAWPVDGVLFDVEHNAFWYPAWGGRPADRGEAVTLARGLLASVPQMVPVFSHRYLPAGSGSHGHPVLSMHQTDIIFYGDDLVDYIDHEFGTRQERTNLGRQPMATVPFWRDLVQ